MQIALPSTITRRRSLVLRGSLPVMAALFIAAFGIRLYQINAPPLNFQATREYRSLIIARDDYFQHTNAVPAWEKQVAAVSRQRQGTLEPPIFESIVALAYGVAGGERLWIPKVLSSLFWLIGGVFLFLIAKRLAGEDAAVFSTTFYLFLPFAIVASRSFQPDPLMIMMLLANIFATLRYAEQPSTSRLAIATGIATVAFFIKPMCLFAIIGVFAALSLDRLGIRRTLMSRATWIFGLITLLPTLLVYGYGTITGNFLVGEAQKAFLPQILTTTFFWRHLLINIGNVVGFGALILALVGVLLFREGRPRALMVGLWFGYVVFDIAFDYNVATHNYYQMQLIPIVALSLGPLAALLMCRLRQVAARPPWRLAAWGVALLALLLCAVVARPMLVNPDGGHEATIAHEIGRRVNHSTDTIYLAQDYGVPLEYHGLLSGSPWPIASDLEEERLAGLPPMTAEQRYDTWFAQKSPEYFIIIDPQDYEQQADLRAFLTQHFPILAQTKDYTIFDLRQRQALGVKE